VDYAIDIPYDLIHNRSVDFIKNQLGGLDGIKNFDSGQTLIFFQQEFPYENTLISDYNNGWSDIQVLWGARDWDQNAGIGWDQASYVSGFIEHSLNSTTPNRRAGVWRININTDGIVTLELVKTMNFNDRLYVRNGDTHGSTNVFYDPVVRDNKTVPGYTTLTQQLNIRTTTFDGSGTRFFSQRDKYTLPEENNKYIKFGKLGVFN
jgi:hypothetical protein